MTDRLKVPWRGLHVGVTPVQATTDLVLIHVMLHSCAVINQSISVYQQGACSSVSAQAARSATRNITQWMHCVCY